MNRHGERVALSAILITFFVLSTIYSLVVPPFEASDELWHYPMVKHIADTGSLPVQNPANVGPWRQEGSQPPLYYALGALVTCWIDTSDMHKVRHLNPHADNGIATPDGNVNLVVHRPGQRALPWRGTVLAVQLTRLLSVALATCGVALTYFVVREVFPLNSAVALGATAVHAFTPMVVFIAGSVNNDNLAVPISSLALLLLLRLLRAETKHTPKSLRRTMLEYLPLGVVLGLAALTKASSLGLTLLTALVVVVRAVRRRTETASEFRKELLVGGLSTLLPLLVVSGWWYIRNLRLYGDPTGLNVFVEILGEREVPASLAQLWQERYSFLAGYWGNFGGLNVPMASWAYRTLNLCLVAAGLGLVVTVATTAVRAMRTESRSDGGHAPRATDCTSPSSADHPTEWAGARPAVLPFLVCLLWGLGVLIPWVQWARVTWSSQGRLLFPALPTWSLLLTLGLRAWWPRRFWIGSHLTLPPLVLLLVLFLLGLSVAAPFVWIRPVYARPDPLSQAQIERIPERTDVKFDETMRLLGYDMESDTTTPGGEIEVTLFWEALGRTEEDHVVFVHLLDQHELVVAQRDTLPGLGLLSTTWLDPGYRWADRYFIPVPATAYSPNQGQIEVGLFRSSDAQRLPAIGPDGVALGDNLRFGQVSIEDKGEELPNPIAVNFGHRMLLKGYNLSQRSIRSGQTLTLTLHWEAARAMNKNYTVSAQLIDSSQRKAAQHDSWPLEGAAPTATWSPGEAVTDTIHLTVSADAKPDAYDLRIAVYSHETGEIRHLPVTPPGGRMQSTAITLTGVRVLP